MEEKAFQFIDDHDARAARLRELAAASEENRNDMIETLEVIEHEQNAVRASMEAVQNIQKEMFGDIIERFQSSDENDDGGMAALNSFFSVIGKAGAVAGEVMTELVKLPIAVVDALIDLPVDLINAIGDQANKLLKTAFDGFGGVLLNGTLMLVLIIAVGCLYLAFSAMVGVAVKFKSKWDITNAKIAGTITNLTRDLETVKYKLTTKLETVEKALRDHDGVTKSKRRKRSKQRKRSKRSKRSHSDEESDSDSEGTHEGDDPSSESPDEEDDSANLLKHKVPTYVTTGIKN